MALVIAVALGAQLSPPQEPIIRKFHWSHSFFRDPWTFDFKVKADANGADWTALGKVWNQPANARGHWSVAKWNALAGKLLPEARKIRPEPGVGVHGAYNLQIDSEPLMTFESAPDSHFEEELVASPIGAIEKSLQEAAWTQERSHWITRTYTLKTVPASKICGFLQGQYKQLEFTVLGSNEFRVSGRPETLSQLSGDLPHLDRKTLK